MEPLKVVVHFTDGRIVKGHTSNFSADKSSFHVCPVLDSPATESCEILLKDIKAIFVVKDFSGVPAYSEEAAFPAGKQPIGRKAEIRFYDGEVIVGSVVSHDPRRPGFIVIPADPRSNNRSIFVSSSAVSEIRYL